jgi:hypothetical protein
MNYTTLQEAMEQAGLTQEIDALSVYRAFEQVQDGRHKRGVRESRALILTLIVLGKLSGMTTLAGIAQWVRLRAEWLWQVLPGARKSFPCAATTSLVLRAVDAEQVSQMINDLLTRVGAEKRGAEDKSRVEEPEPRRPEQAHLALDGKTRQSTLGHVATDQKKMHQLALYETRTGVILKEQVTGEKQNDLSIVAQFLTPVLVKGRLISADVLHTEVAPSVSV